MKKLILLMGLTLLLSATGCGSNEVNGKGPEEIPVEWATAMIQKDQGKRLELLDDKTDALNPNEGPKNKEKVKKYRLTEWKASNDSYFYKIEFKDPIKDEMKTETMEVIKTDSGWKRTEYLNLNNFDSLVKDIEPKVVKELN